MDYKEISVVDSREVILFFLKCEKEDESWMRKICSLPESDFLREITNYHNNRPDRNPVLEWVVNRRNRIKSWLLATIALRALYSNGMNERINIDFNREDVWGNIKRFTDGQYAQKHSEFRLNTVPEGEKRIVFCVDIKTPRKNGTIELLDGAHRVVSMIANGIEESTAYIAELK